MPPHGSVGHRPWRQGLKGTIAAQDPDRLEPGGPSSPEATRPAVGHGAAVRPFLLRLVYAQSLGDIVEWPNERIVTIYVVGVSVGPEKFAFLTCVSQEIHDGEDPQR